jgi:hypothetical protein
VDIRFKFCVLVLKDVNFFRSSPYASNPCIMNTIPLTPARPHAASVSRNLPAESLPRLFHSLSNPNNSVLSLCADANHIFSGSQCPDISVRWNALLKTVEADQTLSSGMGQEVLRIQGQSGRP